MRIQSRLGLLVVVVAVAAGLAGCSQPAAAGTAAGKPSVTASPTPSIVRTAAAPVSGTGTTQGRGTAFPLAAGAKSVDVSFACAGGAHFGVELGNTMADPAMLTGTCDGIHQLAWPITDQTLPALTVIVPDGVKWRATPTFSTADVTYDPAVTSDCKALSVIESALMNADAGYRIHAFGAPEWTRRVDKASTDLHALAAASHSNIHDALGQLSTAVDDARGHVGSIFGPASSGGEPGDEIGNACNTNQTPIIMTGEFGG